MSRAEIFREGANPVIGTAGEYPAADSQRVVQPVVPTAEGTAFGVFDFGGGTTDFAFGLYRPATPEETRNEGWEKVAEILDVAGDSDLGGEEILLQLTCLIARANMNRLLANGCIPILKLENCPPINGGDDIFNSTPIARVNSARLCEKLRPLWEQGRLPEEEDYPGQIAATLIDSQGEEKLVVLNVNRDVLLDFIKNRITHGVDLFFTAFCQSFSHEAEPPRSLHIILGGNSCKSPFVMECFRQKARAILQDGGGDDRIILHPPLLDYHANRDGVTLKTGVAIGLLRTLPGEPFGVIERMKSYKEAPLEFTVGPTGPDDCLKPVLTRHSPYGEWLNFARVPRHGKIIFLYSSSPLALEGLAKRGENCRERVLDWGRENAGKAIFVKAVKPATIRFAMKDDKGNIIAESLDYILCQ